jgi:hypothetical protein
MLYVNHKIIITSQKAKISDIGFLFKKFPKLFKRHEDADDHILYLFIMHERLKKERSFWCPYFDTVEGMDLVMFWSD